MKKRPGRPSKFPYEFKRMVVDKVMSKEMTHREAAAKYNVAHGQISAWKKIHAKGGLRNMNPMDLGSQLTPASENEELKQENKALKIEVAELYMQVKLLKKAEEFYQTRKKDSLSVITSENLDKFKRRAK